MGPEGRSAKAKYPPGVKDKRMIVSQAFGSFNQYAMFRMGED
jgi:hypothetical protein